MVRGCSWPSPRAAILRDASLRECVCVHDANRTKAVPRKRGIQYAAASRFHRTCSGILDHPLSRMMTAGAWYRFEFQTSCTNTPPRSRRAGARVLSATSRHLNQRAQGMPGARSARSRAWCVVNTRVSHHGHAGSPGIPRAMVLTVSFALLCPQNLAECANGRFS